MKTIAHQKKSLKANNPILLDISISSYRCTLVISPYKIVFESLF